MTSVPAVARRQAAVVYNPIKIDVDDVRRAVAEAEREAGWKTTLRFERNTIIVGNCEALPANILLLPDAAIDDDVFDILLLRPESIFGWLQIIYKVLWENGVIRRLPFAGKLKGREADALRYVKAKSVVVTLKGPQDIEIDGDGFGKAVGFCTTVKPGGLKVRVPQGD